MLSGQDLKARLLRFSNELVGVVEVVLGEHRRQRQERHGVGHAPDGPGQETGCLRSTPSVFGRRLASIGYG